MMKKKAQNKSGTTAKGSSIGRDAALLLIIALCGGIIYANTLNAPFVFDDIQNIIEAPHLRLKEISWTSLTELFHRVGFNRPLPTISFALNYYFGAYHPPGYHIVNILIHVLTGGILFLFLRNTMGLLPRNTSKCIAIAQISFFAALLWTVHPIHTQTVTYIVQRSNGMAALFYLLCLYLYAKGRQSISRHRSMAAYAVSALCGLSALACKQNAVMLPVFIFLYEWFFFQDLDVSWIRKKFRPVLVVAVVLIGLALAYLANGGGERLASLHDFANQEFGYKERVLTQLPVVVHYMGLLACPNPSRLNLDYDFPLSTSLLHPITTLFSLGIIIAVFGAAVALSRKHRLLAFATFWFFGNLLIESSVIPLAIIFEHRTYLPSMFVFLPLVIFVWYLFKKPYLGHALLIALIAICSLWTHQRNETWLTEASLWKDTTEKSPTKARPRYNFARALQTSGKVDEAIAQYQKVIQIDPDYADAYSNLGLLYDTEKNRLEEARKCFEAAIRIDPKHWEAYNNLGRLLEKQGDLDQAIAYYAKALKHNPKYTDQYTAAGVELVRSGQLEKAISHYRNGLQIAPASPDMRINLGTIYSRLGRFHDAADQFRQALATHPNLASAHLNLGTTRMAQKRLDSAIEHFRKALSLRPDYPEASENLEKALSIRKQLGDTIAETTSALAQEPERLDLLFNLGKLYRMKGDVYLAEKQFRKVLDRMPDSPPALNALGSLYLAEGQFEKALEIFKQLNQMVPQRPEPYYNIACVYARLEQSDQAMEWLERAADHGFDNWELIKTDPDLSTIRKSSRYRKLIENR